METYQDPETFLLMAGPDVPNNPDLPVVVYRRLVGRHAAIDKFEKAFARAGWAGVWRNGIYSYHHFHTMAHEVLGIARGRVTVHLGGINGRLIDLMAGDMVVLPAGTGHRNAGSSPDLVVIGAYPEGQGNYDICRNLEDCPQATIRIANVKKPATDPFFGRGGPLEKVWDL